MKKEWQKNEFRKNKFEGTKIKAIVVPILKRTRMRCGPFTFSNSYKYARIEMDCRVLPRPISSAKIPLMPFSWFRISQFKPSSWYGRIEP
jgi:hypothetical protein